MATSILPSKFDGDDIVEWLREFDASCALANNWKDEDKIKKLPAFLRGRAATHFYAIPAGERETYDAATKKLKEALCPAVERENYYVKFEARKLRVGEDPSIYKWELEQLLEKADPTLAEEAKSALLCRQFMRGLPSAIRGRLLDHNPTAATICYNLNQLSLVNNTHTRNMQKFVENYIRQCDACIQRKSPGSFSTGSAPLQSIEVSEPFTFWALDYMGPLPETGRGNRHILVLMDHFTKWCEAFPTPDQKASTVAKLLVDKVFSRFGPPVVLHSDQGANFESTLMHEVCDVMHGHNKNSHNGISPSMRWTSRETK